MRIRTRGAKPIGSILDTREIEDPWGLGLRLEIMRAGADRWQAWLKANVPDSPEIKAYLTETWKLANANARGGRLKTKLTTEEIEAQAIERASGKINISGRAENLARLKPGLAAVAIVRLIDAQSAHVKCSACGNRWELDAEDEPCPQCGDLAYLDDPEPIPSTPENIAALLENTRDAAGNIRYLEKYDDEGHEVPHGDQPVGDAIAAWVLEEMGATEKFRASAVAAVKEVLASGLAGHSGNGSTSPQAFEPSPMSSPAASSAPASPGIPGTPSPAPETSADSAGSPIAAGGAAP